MRGATTTFSHAKRLIRISIHAPHAGSDVRDGIVLPLVMISIHAPHAGSDGRACSSPGFYAISIHAPHAGSDEGLVFVVKTVLTFQSTLPMRGATKKCLSLSGRLKFQSTLPMRGATRLNRKQRLEEGYFNPRSPCGERLMLMQSLSTTCAFQSTLPMRGATQLGSSTLSTSSDFNPRSPCGERLSKSGRAYQG